MAKLAREKYAKELSEAKKEHERIMAERRQAQYERHYKVCYKISLDIVDYACKFGEYRELTGGLVPHKLFREWTAMFLNEVALYPDIQVGIWPEMRPLEDAKIFWLSYHLEFI